MSILKKTVYIITDIHTLATGTEPVASAFPWLREKLSGNADWGISLGDYPVGSNTVGDLTSAQGAPVRLAFTNLLTDGSARIFHVTGNHDCGQIEGGMTASRLAEWRSVTGYASVKAAYSSSGNLPDNGMYYSIRSGGDVYLFISAYGWNASYSESGFVFPAEERAFIRSTVDAARAEGRRLFAFCHFCYSNSMSASEPDTSSYMGWRKASGNDAPPYEDYMGRYISTDEDKATLKYIRDYDKSLIFSGHSHGSWETGTLFPSSKYWRWTGGGYSVSVPSLRHSVDQFGSAGYELAVMSVFDDKVVVDGVSLVGGVASNVVSYMIPLAGNAGEEQGTVSGRTAYNRFGQVVSIPEGITRLWRRDGSFVDLVEDEPEPPVVYVDQIRKTNAQTAVIPAGAVRARVQSVGGRSFKYSNIINIRDDFPITTHGVTFDLDDTGAIVVNGTPDTDYALAIVSVKHDFAANHKYFVAGATEGAAGQYRLFVDFVGIVNQPKIVTAAADGSWINGQARINVYNGVTVQNFRVYPMIIDLTVMFGAGNEPTTVAAATSALAALGIDVSQPQPYDPGSIRHTAVENVVWSGNLLSAFTTTQKIFEATISRENGIIHWGGTATSSRAVIRARLFYPTRYDSTLKYGVILGGMLYECEPNAEADGTYSMIATVNLPANSWVSGQPIDIYVYPVAWRGIAPTRWTPYIPPITQTIPSAVLDLPGYGWGVGTASNHIERTADGWQYVQEVSKLTLAIDDMNNLEDYPGWRNFGVKAIIGSAGSGGQFGKLSLLPGNIRANTLLTNDIIYVTTNPPMTQTEWKTQHAGEIYDIYIVRETPIITDITDLMADALPELELVPGMTNVTFDSESGAAVLAEMLYRFPEGTEVPDYVDETALAALMSLSADDPSEDEPNENREEEIEP